MPFRRILTALGVSVLTTLAVLPFFGTSAGAAAANVSIDSTLHPSELHVAPGTTVTWTNNDSNRHRMRSTSGPSSFDVDLSAGKSGSYTFSSVGTWDYRDDRNQSNTAYVGKVVVETTATGSSGSGSGGSTGGSTGGSPPPAPAPASGTVTIANHAYSPNALSVKAGGVVTWNNQDASHTVTSDSGAFDSGVFKNGQSWNFTFANPGTYPYHCDLHPDMKGTITVPAADGSTPPPPPPPPPSSGGGSTPPPSGGTGGTGGSTGGVAQPSSHAVSIVDYSFNPQAISITAGDTVQWTNNGKAAHTVTANDSSFDSGKVASGASFSRTFGSTGTFVYACQFHPDMVGTITVGAAGSPPPPPAAVPAVGAVTGGLSHGSGSGSSAGASSGPGHVNSNVSVEDYDFAPGTITVPAGTQVHWSWTGKAPHTVTADNGSFDSDIQMQGAEYKHTFATPGTFTYHCNIHPDMKGTVNVTNAPAGTTASAGDDGVSGGKGGSSASASGSSGSGAGSGSGGSHGSGKGKGAGSESGGLNASNAAFSHRYAGTLAPIGAGLALGLAWLGLMTVRSTMVRRRRSTQVLA
jgi:plastocyanin